MQSVPITEWGVFVCRFGHLSVYLQMGRSKDPEYIKNGNQLELRLRFRDFVHMTAHQRESNDYYLTANNYLFRQAGFQSMLRDIAPLYKGFMGPEDPDDPAAGVDIWMGPKGTVSPLHQVGSLRPCSNGSNASLRALLPVMLHSIVDTRGTRPVCAGCHLNLLHPGGRPEALASDLPRSAPPAVQPRC